MRISSSTLFENGVNNMLSRQQEVAGTQNHISTGRRVLTPSDDPVAASQMLDISQAQALNKQYADNAQAAKARLGLQENALAAITRLIQDVRTRTVQAGDGALTPSDLRSIAEEVDGRYQELIGLANATDGSSEYLFAGFRTGAAPFAETAPGVVAYLGDEGRREVAVSDSRSIAANDSGSDVFMRIRNGNGTFVTAAAAGNAGTGVVSPGSVTDATLLTGHNYTVTFSVSAATTTYSVVDNTTAATVLNNAPYVAGGPIAFDGLQLAVEGAPANGDAFTVHPSSNVSVFASLDALRTALRSAGAGAVANTELANALNTANLNLSNALDRVLSVHASVGTRLRETEAVTAANEDIDLNYAARLSQLRDLDYARAISDLTFEQMHLEAAQKSFARIAELSLFSLL
ncbi:MAG: flagellar hook-associated protein FlgL [Burkholderiales bacterium]|nr:flagellar hook-associated protein FlgL [Burkholderiales bacterium]